MSNSFNFIPELVDFKDWFDFISIKENAPKNIFKYEPLEASRYKGAKIDIKEQLEEEIKRLTTKNEKEWIRPINDRYRVSKELSEEILNSIQDGNFDVIIDSDYFKTDINELFVYALFRIDCENSGININKITPENCYVFNLLVDYMIQINRKEDLQMVKEKLHEVLSSEYSAIDMIRIIEEYKNDERRQDNLPINKEGLNYFTPQNYNKDNRNEQLEEIDEIQEVINNIKQTITKDNIAELFQNESKNYIEEYVRRMILTQLDIPEIIYNHRNWENLFPDDSKEKTHAFADERARKIDNMIKNMAQKISREMGNSNTNYSKETLNFLFLNPALVNANEDEIRIYKAKQEMNTSNKLVAELIKGLTTSMMQTKQKINLRDTVENLQKEFGIEPFRKDPFERKNSEGNIIQSYYVSEWDKNKWQGISQIIPEFIPDKFENWQKQYDFYYNNATDEQFVTLCTRVMVELTRSQMFIEGNKRTANCLFNSMLLSRGIVPPVISMCENEYEFADKIAKDKPYKEVAKIVLEKWEDIKNQFKNHEVSYPVKVDENAERHVVKASLKLRL